MENTSPRQKLHPMLWIAAASVTAVSLAGVAKLTGILPGSGNTAPEQTLSTKIATAPALPPEAPTMPAAPAAATPIPDAQPAAKPTGEAPARQGEAPPPAVIHKPAPKKEAPKPHPVAKAAAPVEPPAGATPAPPPPPGMHPAIANAPPPPICRDCGVIESIEARAVQGQGSGLGAIGGAILGGVLGHQVGEGSGKQLARIGGAVLGGFAGNEVERRERATTRYDVTVRLEDGTRRVISENHTPAWREGERVRVRNGEIIPAAPPAPASREPAAF